MSQTAATEKSRHEAPSTSLGQLLYSNPQGPRPTEAEWTALVAAIAAGDQRALHALFQRANRIVFTLVLRIVNSRESAEELTVDTFHEVWRRAPAYDAVDGSVVGWIMNLARSRAIDRLRFENRKKRVDPHPEAPDAMPVAGVAEIVELKEQSRRLRRVLDVLTPGEREAVELAFFGERTYAEVAERLCVPLGTVKTRIRSGLVKLRQALAQEASP